jgi:hypothetical protein
MAPDTIPYEIKRFVYDYVDLQTIKSLRQVSKAWASVGLELLLLPSFFIKSHSVDVRRLIDIGSRPVVSRQAAKTIKKVIFQNSGWDPLYFRRIVCNRHEHRQHYDATDFVPTEAEAAALGELDEIERQMLEDRRAERDRSLLISALRVVPQANSIEIQTRNPFRNPILRKVWEEYAVEAYIQEEFQKIILLIVLPAAKDAGLKIQHFSHDQLLSSGFGGHNVFGYTTLYDDFSSLKSLELVVSDHKGVFSTDERAPLRLRRLIEATPALEHLSLSFEILESIPLDFIPTPSTGTLRSLTLSSVSIDPVTFLALLECHGSTLKRLRLRSVDINQGHGSWRGLLEDLRNMFGDKLEKFQVSGMVRSIDGDGEQWLLWPRYDDKWNVFQEGRMPRSPRTKEIEDFVLRRGPWPMVAADTFPFQ